MTNAVQYPLTVYFDATCPLCLAEMRAMTARDEAKRLDLVDCSPASFSTGPAPRAALMTALHAVDASGRLLVGVAAVRACREAVGLPTGGAWLELPLVAALADRTYALLARHRYRLPRGLVALLARRTARRGGSACADGQCRM